MRSDLVGRSKNKGKQAVEAILALHKTVDQYNEDIEDLERRLVELDFDMRVETATELGARLQKIRQKQSTLAATIRTKTLALGVDARNDLRLLTTSKFLQLRMNARALKIRIRERLRERKFEVERFETCYRNSANGALPCFLLYSTAHPELDL